MPFESRRADIMPILRSRVSLPYDVTIKERHNITDELDSAFKDWKSMHRMTTSPYIAANTSNHVMHRNFGFNVLSPRKYHYVLSFEVAHVKTQCIPNCETYLMKDDRLQSLVSNYQKCMSSLSPTL